MFSLLFSTCLAVFHASSASFRRSSVLGVKEYHAESNVAKQWLDEKESAQRAESEQAADGESCWAMGAWGTCV